MPDQWEDTTGKESSEGMPGYKDIVSGKPFLFYFLDDQIQIIKHRDDRIPVMGSDKDCLMAFGWGLSISSNKNNTLSAFAHNSWFVHPENTGNLKIKNGGLYFAGGTDGIFKSLDIEVWGLH